MKIEKIGTDRRGKGAGDSGNRAVKGKLAEHAIGFDRVMGYAISPSATGRS